MKITYALQNIAQEQFKPQEFQNIYLIITSICVLYHNHVMSYILWL